jgi:predicted nucleotidyltransferase
MKALASELLGASRSTILATLLLRPEAELHARELARVTGISIGTLLRELATLHALGLVKRRQAGRQVFFSADAKSPVYADLTGLLRKTVGLGDRLREALLPLADRISAAFVYGSMAAGTAGPHSDVDVMVMGNVTFEDVVEALHPAQSTVGREINPTVMDAAEFASRRRARNSFVQSVIKGPKVWLLGEANELAELGSDRPASPARRAAR